MRRMVRKVVQGPWYLWMPGSLVFCLVMLWPLALAEDPTALPLISSVGFLGIARALNNQILREETGWDRPRRLRELERARHERLPGLLLPLGIAWVLILLPGLGVLAHRQIRERAELVSRVRGVGSEAA